MPIVKLRNVVAESSDKIYQVGIHEVSDAFVEKYKETGVIERIIEDKPAEELAPQNKMDKPKNKKGG